MSTAKKRLCTNLGISETILKGGKLFSPDNQSKNLANDNKIIKGEKAIKYLSTANINKKNSSSGISAYQNYRIDILVPYSDPPKSLITPDNKRFYNKSSTINTCNLNSSPFKTSKDLTSTISSSKRSGANSSYLDNLAYNMKSSNADVYSPFVKAKTKRDSELTGKNNYNNCIYNSFFIF